MQRAPFVVYDQPYCVWEWDLQDRNNRFLERIDSKYFQFVAEVNHPHLEGDKKQLAAAALRIAYHHGQETLFALIGAVLQAPQCVPAWLQRYETRQLRSLVHDISNGTSGLLNRLGISNVSWHSIAQVIISAHYDDEDRKVETKCEFGKLWSRLATDFLSDGPIAEYNSLKHGFRTSLGGFQLTVGVEDTPGQPAKPENMKYLGGSVYGTHYYVPEPPLNSTLSKKDPNFRLRSNSLNWNAEAIAARLLLIAMSIQNIVAFAKIYNGCDPKKVEFTRPVETKVFLEPWQHSVGVTSASMDTIVDISSIRPMSPEEILSTYDLAEKLPPPND